MTMCLNVMEVVSNWANMKAENGHVVDDINFSSTTFISKHNMTHNLHIRRTFNTLVISYFVVSFWKIVWPNLSSSH